MGTKVNAEAAALSTPVAGFKTERADLGRSLQMEEPVSETLALEKSRTATSAQPSPPPTSPNDPPTIGHRFSKTSVETGDRGRMPLQLKLKIGQSNDKYEQEADRVAEQVVSMSHTEPANRKPTSRQLVGSFVQPAIVQRVCSDCEAEEETIQAKKEIGRSLLQISEIEAQLKASKSRGKPLSKNTRALMEPKLGYDFSGVRVHTDSSSAQLNKTLNAQAFTHRQDVYFGSGKYSPGSLTGKRLLAHELTHVVQQNTANNSGQRLQRDLEPAPSTTESSSSIITSQTSPAPAGLSVNMDGLRLLPTAQSAFRTGVKVRQALEIVLSRLVGDQYSVELVDELYTRLITDGWRGLGRLAGDATEGEQIPPFTIFLQDALQIIAWLESVKQLQVHLTNNQRDLLSYGVAASAAWHDINLPEVAREIDAPFPQWYNETLFRQQIAGNIRLLRQYVETTTAYHAERNSANRQRVINALIDIALEFEYTSSILEAIRADSSLTAHHIYQALWPSPSPEDATAPVPTVVAPSNRAPNGVIAAAFLAFVHSQSNLAVQSFTDSAARQELMDRFGRFLGRSLSSSSEGDQQVTESPSTANAPPYASRLQVSPSLSGPPGGAQFEASAAADYRFIMQILFPDVFAAFTAYSFDWNYVRIPDDQISSSVDTRPQKPTHGDIAAHRFRRAGRYALEDVQTLFSGLGPAGIGATSLVTANAILRFAGTGIRLGFEVLTMPSSEKSIVFPEPGVYLVRSKAVPRQDGDAEVLRPPSVAFQPVIVRDPREIVEDRVQQGAAASARDFSRMLELRELLSQPVSHANETDLRRELDQLERALSSVGGSFEVQREQILEYLNSLPTGSAEKPQVLKQLEQLDALITLRKDRANGRDLTAAEPLTASFISDEGRSIRLTMEAVFQSDSPNETTYWVSDLTTANSSQDTGTGRTRPLAIMNAITSILQGYAGYGRGHVSVQIDGQTYTRRIAASLGSLFNEALENVTLALSIAIVAAAPFTGGASIVLLLPVGAVGAIPSAYRLINRSADDTLRLDMATVMDVVNLVGGIAGLGHAATPLRMVNVGRAFMVVGLGTDGLGMLMIPVGIMSQISALEGLPPGERAARIMEILGQAMLNAGIMAGGALAQRARQQRMESHSSRPQTPSSADSTTPGRSRIEGSTLDGNGRLRFTEDGRILRCSSPCVELENRYSRELANDPMFRRRLDQLKANFEGVDPTDFRTLERLFSELQRLESNLEGARVLRTSTLTPARTEFPDYQADLMTIENQLAVAGRTDMVEVINDVARSQSQQRRITGFEHWIEDARGRSPAEVVDEVAALFEVRNILREASDTGLTIRIGEDSQTAGKSFDIIGDRLSGGTLRTDFRLEMKRRRTPVDDGSHLIAGITHAAEKIPRAVRNDPRQLPSGNLEGGLVVQWPPAPVALGGGAQKIYRADGAYGVRRSGQRVEDVNFNRNLLDDLVDQHLNKFEYDNPVEFVHRGVILDQNGNRLFEITNTTVGNRPSVWTWRPL